MIRKDIMKHARQYDGWNSRQIQRAGPYSLADRLKGQQRNRNDSVQINMVGYGIKVAVAAPAMYHDHSNEYEERLAQKDAISNERASPQFSKLAWHVPKQQPAKAETSERDERLGRAKCNLQGTDENTLSYWIVVKKERAVDFTILAAGSGAEPPKSSKSFIVYIARSQQ